MDALGLETVGDPGDDGLPEPLQFRLGEGVNLMLIPRRGFGWVLGEQPAAEPNQSESIVNLVVEQDEDVDSLIAAAESAGAEVKLRPESKSWGYTGSFTDPDGHFWAVTKPVGN